MSLNLGDFAKGIAAFGLAKITFVTTAIQQAIERLKADNAGGSAATGNFLLTGGGVAYTSGLNVIVGASTYSIQGTSYASAQTSLTSDAADGSNPRIDVVALNSAGAAVIIKGTPAATPVKPDVDPTTQLELTFFIVAAGSSALSIASTDVYLENAQYTTSQSGGQLTLASTNNPRTGAVCIEATAFAANSYGVFTVPAAGTVDLSTRDNLVFYMRSKAAWNSNRSLTWRAYNAAGVALGNAVVMRNGSYGWDSSNVASYQQIVIPLSLFGVSNLAVSSIRFTSSGNGGSALGFYMDDVKLQGGLALTVDSTRMKFRDDWTSTTFYNTNDTVISSGVTYVARQNGINQTPASSPTYWRALPQVSTLPVFIELTCSDESTALTTGTGKITFRAPFAFTLTAVRASVTTAPTGGTLLTVDVNENGTSVISTKLTFDASEKTTVTAATPAVISDSSIGDDSEMSVDIDAVGSTIAGAGLKVYLIGTRPVPAATPVVYQFACSDETTALTAGTSKMSFRTPRAFTLTAVRVSLTTAQTSGSIFTVDVNENGTSILSTKATIDNTEKTTTTAATPLVISDASIADDAEITVDIDQIGDGTAKGLKVTLIGTT